MFLLILFFCSSIIFSFLCSIWEAVLLSISPSHILGPISLNYEAIIAAVMTLAILILSEIIPKTIGAIYWKKLTPFTIRSVNLLIILMFPLVWLSQWITKHLKSDELQSVLSRSDLAAYAEIGEVSGAINSGESRIITNLLKMKSLRTRDIMTPRTVIMMMDENATVEEYNKTQHNSPFSRIPVYQEKRDQVTGIVLKDDILQSLADDQNNTLLKDLKRNTFTVSDQMLLPLLFETLLEKKLHLCLVADEFGSLLGLVTLEDVMETLLGIEIVDETDEAIDLQALAREKWNERAKNLGLLPEETENKD